MNQLLTRKTWTYVHLAIAAFFLPYLFFLPLTGASHLLGINGTQVKTEAFRIKDIPLESGSDQKEFFKAEFERQGIDYRFDSIKGSKTSLTFRPTTRTYYTGNLSDAGDWVFTKVEPDLHVRLLELHKGHGPKVMKYYQAGFGVALILITLSGLWLAWTVRPYRKAALISFSLGLIGILFAAFVL